MNIELYEEEKRALLESIRLYFLDEREEDLGELACLLIFDFISKEIGPTFYNKGIKDASKYISEKLEDLYELEI